MQAERYEFRVERRDREAAITLNCGKGVYRCRVMPFLLLKRLADLCEEVRRTAIPRCKRRRHFADRVPSYPDCIALGRAEIPGVCELTLVASATAAGAIEFCTAIYDAGDDTAPVLILVDEQLPAFIEQARAILDEAEDLDEDAR